MSDAKPAVTDLQQLLDQLGVAYELLPPPAEGLLPGFRLPCGCGFELRGPMGDEEHYTVCDRPACTFSPIFRELAQEQAKAAGIAVQYRGAK